MMWGWIVWMLGPNWPTDGEIDIIEGIHTFHPPPAIHIISRPHLFLLLANIIYLLGVNANTYNLMSLHS